MPFVRRLLAQRHLALLILAAALALRIAVPGGYMIGGERGAITLEVCSGVAAMPDAMTMPSRHHHPTGDHGKVEMPCAFAGLSAPALAATDPLVLTALIAFVVAAGTVPIALPATRRAPFLRPPLRGPPIRL